MEIKTIGSPCGSHGPYTFYKGLKIIPMLSQTIFEPKDTATLDTVTDLGKISAQTWSVTLAESNNVESKCKVATRQNCTEKWSNTNITAIQEGLTKPLVLVLGDCIPVRPWSDSSLTCLAEIRMIWRDKNEQRLLTGLRLYFLPENTPMGRNCHGEDEVVAISDKVVVRAEDFLNWFDEKVQWTWGMIISEDDNPSLVQDFARMKQHEEDRKKTQANEIITESTSLKNSRIDFADVEDVKFSGENASSKVIVLSYSNYCRYRATLKRLENMNDMFMKKCLVQALCGVTVELKGTRVMFCKDTFDYPELETHEQLCNHLAPKLTGRPRGRKNNTGSESPFYFEKQNDSYSDTNESDASAVFNQREVPSMKQYSPHLRFNHRPARTKLKSKIEYKKFGIKNEDVWGNETESDGDENENTYVKTIATKNYSNIDKTFLSTATEKSKKIARNERSDTNEFNMREEKFFLRKLHEFHVKHNNHIPKMFWFSLKGVCLYAIFCQVKKLGGFNAVTKRQWKALFGEKTGPHNTITRKKYERILLPLERSELVTKKQTKANVKETLRLNNEKLSSLEKLKITIKRDNKCETELSREQMTEIQNIVRSKMTLNSDVDLRHCATSSTSHRTVSDSSVSMPVMVIVGSKGNECAPTDAAENAKQRKTLEDSYRMRTSTLTSSSQKIQIQQPHTTITVHQTTIRPQIHSKHTSIQSQITSQIQITNQIQIQQITVQPNGDSQQGRSKSSEFRCNIKQDGIDQEIKIERDMGYARRYNGDDSLKPQNLRVKTEPMSFEKENIPFVSSGTTISPVLTLPVSVPRKTPEIIELLDSDGESELPRQKEIIPVKLQNMNRKIYSDSAIMPPVKKRKLDILREGGLEVTAISNTHGIISTSSPLSPVSLRIPFHTSKECLQKCKTENRKFNLPSATSLTITNINAVPNNPSKITINSIYASTGKVFGNPKEILPSSSCQTNSDCILDLTKKSQQHSSSLNLHSNLTKQDTLSSVGSNEAAVYLSSEHRNFQDPALQITLLPPQTRNSHTSQQNDKNSPNKLHHTKRGRRKSYCSEIKQEATTTTKQMVPTITDTSISQPGQTTLTELFGSKSLPFVFPSFISHLPTTVSNPFLPIFNPVLLSNFYSQNPNVFQGSQHSQEQLKLFKEVPSEMVPITKN